MLYDLKNSVLFRLTYSFMWRTIYFYETPSTHLTSLLEGLSQLTNENIIHLNDVGYFFLGAFQHT